MATIFCPNKLCGKEVSSEFPKCPFCGTSLEGVQSGTDSSTNTPRTPPTEKNKVKENRNPWLYTIITMLTVTLSNLVIFTRMTKELNRISAGQNELTPYLAVVFINIFTSGIFGLIWFSNFTGTLGEELRYRGITYKYNRWTYWGWCVLGYFILVGPIIYFYKTFKAFNLLAKEYNERG